MSNFERMSRHPETGHWEKAQWLDDYYGRHQYAVSFIDGTIYPADKIETRDETYDETIANLDALIDRPHDLPNLADKVQRLKRTRQAYIEARNELIGTDYEED